MDHMNHRPGPIKDCAGCRRTASEPTWCAALVAFDLTTTMRGQTQAA